MVIKSFYYREIDNEFTRDPLEDYYNEWGYTSRNRPDQEEWLEEWYEVDDPNAIDIEELQAHWAHISDEEIKLYIAVHSIKNWLLDTGYWD